MLMWHSSPCARWHGYALFECCQKSYGMGGHYNLADSQSYVDRTYSPALGETFMCLMHELTNVDLHKFPQSFSC